MPCQQTCEVKRLNLILKDVEQDKIRTLRDIYDVTDQIGKENPRRFEEMTRNKQEIKQKLMTGVAELMIIEEEIERGCTTCRES